MTNRAQATTPSPSDMVDELAMAQQREEDVDRLQQLELAVAERERQAASKPVARSSASTSSNKIGARKTAAFKAISTAPSINKTPVGPTMVPLPYPTVQDLSTSIRTAKSVKFNGCPAYLLGKSTQPKCQGDERGTGKGIKSGTVSGEVKPVAGCKTVRIEGKQVVRQGDPCTMNGGNNPGIYVTTASPSSAPAKNAIAGSNPPSLKPNNTPLGLADAHDADQGNGLLASLAPRTPLDALIREIQSNTLKGKFESILERLPADDTCSAKVPRRNPQGPYAIAGSGNPLSPAEEFVERNHSLYDSPIGGAAFGLTWFLRGSEETARIAGAAGSSIDLFSGAALGGGFIRRRPGNVISRNSGLRAEPRGPEDDLNINNAIELRLNSNLGSKSPLPSQQAVLMSPSTTFGVKILAPDTRSRAEILDDLRSKFPTEIKNVTTFKTLGLSNSEIEDYLNTEDGLIYVAQLKLADPASSPSVILRRAFEQLRSGKNVPKKLFMRSALLKIVPQGRPVSNFTPFFTVQEELTNAKNSGITLGEYFGLPIQSISPVYDIYKMEPESFSPVYVSEIARTEELRGLLKNSGGGIQYVVPNRTKWPKPIYVGTITDDVKP